MHQVDLAGVSVGALDRAGWLDHLTRCVQAPDRAPHHHVSLNAAKWDRMRHDRALRAAVHRATSVAADGIGIVAAARWRGTPVPERVPGIDLAEDLLGRASERGWRVALLGAEPAVLAAVDEQQRARGVEVVFAQHGYAEPGPADDANDIREARPDLLLVALGTPLAEQFIDRYQPTMRVPLAMGVGGSFDVWAGRSRRAPALARRWGLEWAWRLAGDPAGRFERAIRRPAAFAAAMATGARVPGPDAP